MQAIGVMAFAYVMHHNCFLVYTSIKDANLAKYILMAPFTFAS
jgi:sodium-coupled neutral amino acid transporter 11